MLTDKDLELGNIVGIAEVINRRAYKYVGFKAAKDFILFGKNTLKFSSPDDFNDPFDCHEVFVSFSNIPSDAEIDKMANKMLNSSIAKEAAHMVKKALNSKNEMAKIFKELKKDVKISCFSKVYDDVLMWSHYANKHTGICIGFDFPVEPQPKDFIVLPVKYKNVIQPFDVKATHLRILLHWLTTKSYHWEYEQEIRAIINSDSKKLLKDDDNNYYYNIERDWIKEVVFGCKVSNKEMEETVKLLKRAGYRNILIKKMSIDSDTFSLKETIIADIQNHKNKIK